MECERPISSTAECTDIESQLSAVEDSASRVLSSHERYGQDIKTNDYVEPNI